MLRSTALRCCLLCVVLTALVAGCSSTPAFRYVSVTGRLPDMAGESLTGGPVSTSAYAGNVVVVNFWNPYCSPCRQEQRTLSKAWNSLGSRGVMFFGIHAWGVYYPYRLATARDYLREFGVGYPVLDDPKQDLIHRFGVDDIPTTLVADAGGNLRFKILGPVKPGELELLVEMAETPAPSGSASSP